MDHWFDSEWAQDRDEVCRALRVLEVELREKLERREDLEKRTR